MISIGIIGFGSRMTGLANALYALHEDVCITCVADPNKEDAQKRLADCKLPCDGARFYSDADELLANERPDAIVLATRCDTHAHLADKVIRKGIPLLLEKPVATDEEGYKILMDAARVATAPVFISFPLRFASIALVAKEIVDSGKLGPIASVWSACNVNYARGYYKKWYRDADITGGMFLQKATHDLDLIFYLLGAKPVSLCAMESRNVMGGDMPAGISCDDCPKYRTCPESSWTLETVYGEPPQPHACSFGEDIKLQDSGSVSLMLDNGVQVSYSQCFVARKSANRRMTRIIGLKGTLEFDFATDKATFYDHTSSRIERYEYSETGNHGGGDEGLWRQFLQVLRGETNDYPTLRDGIISGHTCLLAQQYAKKAPYFDCSIDI